MAVTYHGRVLAHLVPVNRRRSREQVEKILVRSQEITDAIARAHPGPAVGASGSAREGSYDPAALVVLLAVPGDQGLPLQLGGSDVDRVGPFDREGNGQFGGQGHQILAHREKGELGQCPQLFHGQEA